MDDSALRHYDRQIRMCNFGTIMSFMLAVESGGVGLLVSGRPQVVLFAMAAVAVLASLTAFRSKTKYQAEYDLEVCRSVLES